MRIFKTKLFAKWAGSQKLTDLALKQALGEVLAGSVDVSLGGNLFKKRIAIGSRGKSSGVRTILVYKTSMEKAFFIYGFAKNELNNIDNQELKALKLLAKIYVEMTDDELETSIIKKELSEVF